MRRGRRACLHISVLTLVLLGLTLSACGWTRSTPPVVKIGLIAPFEGLGRPVGYEALHAVQLALQEYDQSRHAPDYLVALVALNDDDTPQAAHQQALKLGVDGDVVAVIGPLSRDTVEAAAGPLAEANLAWVAPVSVADAVVQNNSNGYRVFASDGALADMAIALGRETDGDDASRCVCIDPLGDFVGPLSEAAERAGVCWERGEAEWGECSVVALGGDAAQVADRLASVAENADVVVAGPEAGRRVVPQRAGADADGLIWVSSVPPLDRGAMPETFVDGFEAMAGQEPGPAAALAYDSARVLLAAIEYDAAQHGRPSREGVVEALASVSIQGLSGIIEFEDTGSWVSAPVLAYTMEGQDICSQVRFQGEEAADGAE